MLRSVRKMSMSSDVLDTHSCAASGPVISVFCSSGGVISETPLLPATSDDDDEDAWCDALVAAAPRCCRIGLGSGQRAGDALAFGAVRLGEVQVQPGPLRARERPLVLVTEMIFAVAGADRELDRRLQHHAVVDVLEPVVEEPQLVAPAVLAMERMEVRAAVDAQFLLLGRRPHVAFGGAAQAAPCRTSCRPSRAAVRSCPIAPAGS